MAEYLTKDKDVVKHPQEGHDTLKVEDARITAAPSDAAEAKEQIQYLLKKNRKALDALAKL